MSDLVMRIRTLEAALSRVRALQATWAEACPTTHVERHRLCKAGLLLAALDGPTEELV